MTKKVFTINRTSAISLIIFEIVIGVIWSCISFVIFIKIAKGVLNNSFISFDTTLSYAIYSIRSPFMNQIMKDISYMGSDVILFAAIVMGIFLLAKKYKHEAFLFTIILAIGVFLNFAFKAIFARNRPDFNPVFLEAFYSFPSGHSMNSFIFYMTIAFFIFRFTRKKTLSIFISVICIFLVGLIGFSRVYLGVHYPTDVIAGYIAGFWVFITALVIDKTLYYIKEFRS